MKNTSAATTICEIAANICVVCTDKKRLHYQLMYVPTCTINSTRTAKQKTSCGQVEPYAKLATFTPGCTFKSSKKTPALSYTKQQRINTKNKTDRQVGSNRYSTQDRPIPKSVANTV